MTEPSSRLPAAPQPNRAAQPRNSLHGLELEAMVNAPYDFYGLDVLA